MNSSPPYPPTTASLGGSPTVALDVPVCAVFLALFICGAISHMTILQVNLRRGHKFLISGMMFGFCMARITTLVMRIVSATRPRNLRVAIAATIFVYAGVVLLFVVNLIFAQRILRACHPTFGWHRLLHHSFTALYVLIVLTLAMLLTASVQSIYTANLNTRRIDRDIVLYGQTFYSVVSFLPIPMVIGGVVIPRKTRIEKFGQGRFRTKIRILLTTSFLLCLGACFRAGTNYAGGERPIRNPAGYQGKACFYIFNFAIEIVITLLYVVVRIDKRFWVPNHSKGPGDYLRGRDVEAHKEEPESGKSSAQDHLGDMITTEEETFDNKTPEEVTRSSTTAVEVDKEKAVHGEEEKAVHGHKYDGVQEHEKSNVEGESEKAVQGDESTPVPSPIHPAAPETKEV